MPDKPMILVADDEEDMRELVCINLEQAGFQTAEAVNGLEAIRMRRRGSAPRTSSRSASTSSSGVVSKSLSRMNTA